MLILASQTNHHYPSNRAFAPRVPNGKVSFNPAEMRIIYSLNAATEIDK